jgi:hypothetical protein
MRKPTPKQQRSRPAAAAAIARALSQAAARAQPAPPPTVPMPTAPASTTPTAPDLVMHQQRFEPTGAAPPGLLGSPGVAGLLGVGRSPRRA